jgi:hypothetical protein
MKSFKRNQRRVNPSQNLKKKTKKKIKNKNEPDKKA